MPDLLLLVFSAKEGEAVLPTELTLYREEPPKGLTMMALRIKQRGSTLIACLEGELQGESPETGGRAGMTTGPCRPGYEVLSSNKGKVWMLHWRREHKE